MRISTSWIIKAIGFLMLAIGLVAAFYAPCEIFVYYIFSEGGQFHYEGFGMGSLWFAIVTMMNSGYYVIAAICLPLGYGWIKLQRWALTLARVFAELWLFFGVLLSIYAVFVFRSFIRTDIENFQIQPLPLLLLTLFFLLVVPALLVILFNHRRISQEFAQHDPRQYWTERTPRSLLAVLAMIAALMLALHLTIFFQGIFPWFGRVLVGRSSARIIASNILLLGGLTLGLIKLKTWARWGSIAYFALLLVSSAMTFFQFNLYAIIQMLQLPHQETQVVENFEPLLQISLFGLTTVPLLLTLGLLVNIECHLKKNRLS